MQKTKRPLWRRDGQALQAGTVRTMFHIISLMAVSISLEGWVRVLVRAAQHMPVADGPRVAGAVQGNTFNGTFHDRGGTGSFQGQRSN